MSQPSRSSRRSSMSCGTSMTQQGRRGGSRTRGGPSRTRLERPSCRRRRRARSVCSVGSTQRYHEALAEFEAAHRTSLEVGTTEQQFIARWAIGRCLRSLGQYDEALAIQQQLATRHPEDEYVREEVEELRNAMRTS